MLFRDPVLAIILVAIFLLVAYPVHEFAHAFAAYRQGDATAKLFGRLTLNPIVHFDKVGGTLTAASLLFSPILFGWAKPTPVNPANFKDRTNGDLIVALAGPAANLVMAALGGLVFRVLAAADVLRSLPEIAVFSLYYFVMFNVLLMLFNLIPIPPLDGSAILFRFLSPRQQWQIRPILNQYGFFILIAVFLLGGGVIGNVMVSVTNALLGVG